MGGNNIVEQSLLGSRHQIVEIRAPLPTERQACPPVRERSWFATTND
jgi:hypothetical protein